MESPGSMSAPAWHIQLQVAEFFANRYHAPQPQVNGEFRNGDDRHASCIIHPTIDPLSWQPQLRVERGLSNLCDRAATQERSVDS